MSVCVFYEAFLSLVQGYKYGATSENQTQFSVEIGRLSGSVTILH